MVLHVVWTPVVFALRQRVWDWEGDRPVEPRPVHQTTRTSRRSSASTRASPSGSLCWSAAPKSHGADDAEPRPTRRSTMTNDCPQYFAGDAGDVVGALASEGVLRMVAVLRGLNQGEFADLAAARDGEPDVDPVAWSLKPPTALSCAYS